MNGNDNINTSSGSRVEKLAIGHCFPDPQTFRVAAGEFFAASNRSFTSCKNNGSKQKTYLCSGKPGGCQAFVRAYRGASRVWSVKKINASHANCSGGTTRGKSAALQGAADLAMKDNPAMSGVALRQKIERDSGVKLSQRTATRMKDTAKKATQAAMEGSYAELPSLCALLRSGCPGTVAEVEQNEDGTFKRLFVMLGRAAHVCVNSPMKVLCVDAGHLKGAWKGQMLIASAKDANNTVLHVATVICDKETTYNYSFLYRMMKENDAMNGFLSSPKTTIFTDQHKSHEGAIREHANDCQWRFCLRHIISNLKPPVGGVVNMHIFHAAKACTEDELRHIMTTKVQPTKPAAYEALMKPDLLPRWAHCAGSLDTVIGNQTTSNPVEQNMNMVGPEARALSPYGLVMNILEKTARKMAERAELRKGTGDRFTPNAGSMYEEARQVSSGMHCTPTGNGLFNVQDSRSHHRVHVSYGTEGNITGATCTCSRTKRFNVPCAAMIAVGRELNKPDDIMALVDSAYLLDTYRGLYGDAQFRVQLPVPAELSQDSSMRPPPQVEGRAGRPQKGPPQKKRIRSRGEFSSSSAHNVRQPSGVGAALPTGSAVQSFEGGLSQSQAGAASTQQAAGLSQSQGAAASTQQTAGLSQSQGAAASTQQTAGLPRGDGESGRGRSSVISID